MKFLLEKSLNSTFLLINLWDSSLKKKLVILIMKPVDFDSLLLQSFVVYLLRVAIAESFNLT